MTVRTYHPRMIGEDRQIRIERATPSRLPHLAGVLGRAFAHDPMTQWPFDGNASVETITSIFAMLYEHPVELGLVWEAGDGAGVAVWVPPGAAELLSTSDEAAREKYEPLMPDRGERYRAMWAWLEAFVANDAWYLDAIGVDPARQRSGVGGALIRHGLALAANDGAPAFLETALSENVPYYERFGFNVVDQGDVPNGGPHIWFMRREAERPPL